MVRTRQEPAEQRAPEALESHGVVIKQQLIALGAGRATGTYRAIGAIDGVGKASSDTLVPPAPPAGRPVRLEGEVVLCAPTGRLVIAICAVTRVVPETGVLTGGGTWTLRDASGTFDGLRASGASTMLVVYDPDGTVSVDVVLTGHVVAEPGLPPEVEG